MTYVNFTCKGREGGRYIVRYDDRCTGGNYIVG